MHQCFFVSDENLDEVRFVGRCEVWVLDRLLDERTQFYQGWFNWADFCFHFSLEVPKLVLMLIEFLSKLLHFTEHILVTVSLFLLHPTFEDLKACLVNCINQNLLKFWTSILFNGYPSTFLLGFWLLLFIFDTELYDYIHIVRLKDFHIILNLFLDVALVDFHFEEIFKERLKLTILCIWTEDAFFVLSQFLASLRDHDTVKHDLVCYRLSWSLFDSFYTRIELHGTAVEHVVVRTQ